jgi:uncharacterized repeat protein (TIGR02543 family)
MKTKKHVKQWMKLAIVSAVTFCVVLHALAETATVDGVTWTFTVSGGKATVTDASPAVGKLSIPSQIGDYPVTSIGNYTFSYCTRLTSVTIPDSVTSIGEEAFSECNNLKSVAIGSGMMHFGPRVFLYCTELESFSVASGNPAYKSVDGFLLTKDGKTLVHGVNGDVSIPDGVTSIGGEAFYGRTGLTSVTIPDSVTSIKDRAFVKCTGVTTISMGNGLTSLTNLPITGSLTNIVIGNGVKSIKAHAFQDCTNLVSVTIGNGVKSIGEYAFFDCNKLTSVTIPDSVTSIGYCAFSGCTGVTTISTGNGLTSLENLPITGSLTNIVIGNGVTSIGEYAFSWGTNLASVTIGNGVTSIGEYAFFNCSKLTSVTLPDSVRSIGKSVFDGCSELTIATIGNGVTNIGNYAFRGCSRLKTVAIGNGVTSIGYCAFDGCSELTSVTIPDSVTRIGNEAFSDCTSLKTMTIGNGVKSIGENAFSGCSGLLNLTIPNSVKSLGGGAFIGCTGLTSVTIGNGVKSIGENVFCDCTGLTSVTIPDSVTNIEGNAFCDCKGLTSVTIGTGVKTIGENAFFGCRGLKNLTILGNVTGPSTFKSPFDGCANLATLVFGDNVSQIGSYMFSGCSGLTSVTIPDSVTSIGAGAFEDCSGLKSVTIGNGVKSIEGSVFSGCESLKNLTILGNVTGPSRKSPFDGCTNLATLVFGDNVSKIDSFMFYGCSGLTSLTIPNSVTSIGEYAFSDCTRLTSVTIPNSVTSIGENAFYDCTGLKSVTIGNGVTSIGSDAFMYCSGLTSVTIPDSVTEIGGGAFWGCNGLKSVTIGNGVKSIGWGAFSGCTRLTSVVIPDSVTYIGGEAFSGCSGLKTLYVPAAWEGTDMLDYVWGGSGKPSGCQIVYYETQMVTFGANGGNCRKSREKYPIGLSYGAYGKMPEATKEHCFFGGWWTQAIGGERVTEASVVTTNATRTLYAHWVLDADALTWNYTISGNAATVTGVSPTDGFLIVPSELDGYPVAGIGYRALSGCNDLTAVVLPEGVTGIGPLAFQYCTALAEVSIPPGVTDIGTLAFQYCEALSTVVLPQSVSAIGSNVFTHCTNLSKLYVPVAWLGTETVATLGLEEGCEVIYGEPDTETVVFDANDGTCGTAMANYPMGKAYGQLPEAEKDGWAFAGWWTEREGGTRKTAKNIATNEGCRTLYAHWLPLTQEATFDANGGVCDTATRWYAAGGTYSPLPEATRAHHAFSGWFTETDGGKRIYESTAVGEDETRTFFAHWVRVEQEVAFDARGGTCASTDAAYAFGGRYSSLPDASREHYAFDGWFTEPEGGNLISVGTAVTEEGICTFYAHWSLVEQVVTFDANGGTCETETGTYAIGGTYGAFPEATKGSLDFDGWWTDNQAGDQITAASWVTFEETRTLYAHWSGGNEAFPETENDGEVATVLAEATDERLVEKIASVAAYDDFRAWMAAKDLEPQEVKDSPHAWPSYLLGADALFENEPEIRLGGFEVGESGNRDGGMALTVEVTVRDGDKPAAVDAAKVAGLFGATGDLGDWDGPAKLEPTVTQTSAEGDTLRFEVVPGDGRAERAFLRIAE